MIILPATQGSLRGLPYSGPYSRGKIYRGDGDENEKPPVANSGTGTGTMLPAPQGPRILVYIEFYLYTLITYNMYNINIRVNIVFY